ncbi:hypothetical protein ID866_11610 [Astraeus odoratus]|nr:hypothetical protein ID866_11610 [Astraeus odoratus]
MSSPRRTLSPHECCMAKTKAPKERTEEEWKLVSEGELDPVSSDNEKTAEMRDQEKKQRVEEEAERKAEEERSVQEEAARVREEAERLAKEATKREEAVKRAAEAVEERADAERRAVKECFGRMMVAGPSASGCRASGVQDPCARCHNKGTLCVLGATKGKTMACKACRHAKISCSWLKKMVREPRKRKQVRRSEEAEDTEVVDVDEDEDEEWPHFARDSWNLGVATLWAIETITDELRRANDLKEEEMGRGKGKGKEKEEGSNRGRMEDEDRDMEMGGAGPSSLA